MDIQTEVNYASKIMLVIVVLVVLYICYSIVYRFFTSEFFNKNLNRNQTTETLIHLIRSIIRLIFIILAGLFILQIFGVNVHSILASLGLISIIVGFAVQDALKDIIKGFDIITEGYFKVGDIIEFEGKIGKVQSVGLKTTTMEDVDSRNIITISNRKVQIVQTVSDVLNIDIPMSYQLTLSENEEIIQEIIHRCLKLKNIHKGEYAGVQEFEQSYLLMRVRFTTDASQKTQARRDVQTVVMDTLEEHGLSIPYQHIVIYDPKMQS